MTRLSRQNWTKIARDVSKAQSKIANELLDAAEAGGDVAGPQEVVDAIEVIVDQLEEVQAAIPAEPADAEPVVEGPQIEGEVEAPVEEVEAPIEEEEEEEYVAKLKAQVAT